MCQRDIAPHDRVAGGDAGKVPETAGGETENILAELIAGERIHQRIGQHMRQVTGGCEYRVVLLDAKFNHLGARALPHLANQRQGILRGRVGRGQDHPVILEKVCP